MYTQFFGINEYPFSIAPNPHFLYMSERHSEALAHLNFGQGEQGGFVLLTGEVGTGKTTVSRRLIRQLPDSTELAFILNPALTEVELLATVCDELGIVYDKQSLSLKELFDGISRRLLSNHQGGKHTVLLIDEAQHLSLAAMEQLRLLTNLETDARKLLQVILIGQPELQQMLKQNNLRQLAQRITARYHLMPLNINETKSYIEHRLKVAGAKQSIFTPQAMATVFATSGGVPRLINLICDRALMAAYGLGCHKVDAKQVVTAAREILDIEPVGQSSSRWLWFVGGVMAILLVVSLLPPGSIFYLVSGYDSSYSMDARMDAEVLPAQPSIGSLSEASETSAADSEHLLTQQEHTQQSGAEAAQLRPESATQNKALQNQPSVPTSLSALADKARDKAHAYQDLFRIWGIEARTKQANCKTALRLDLNCVHSEGGLDSFLLNNSPAVVELSDEKGVWYAVLFEVDDKFTLLVAEHTVSVSRTWFEQHWQGKATLFWQPPPYYIGQLMVGGKGQSVKWLESSLAQAQGRTARKVYRFDQELQSSVQLFQRQEGLSDDGIAGVQTLIKLRQVLNESLPRLVIQQDKVQRSDALSLTQQAASAVRSEKAL